MELTEKLKKMDSTLQRIATLAWDATKKYDEATVENVVFSKLYCEMTYISADIKQMLTEIEKEASAKEEVLADFAKELHDKAETALEPAEEDELPF